MGTTNSNLDSKSFNYSTYSNALELSKPINVKRSKSYAIPENQVLPHQYISSNLRPLNKYKSDGVKKTWRRNNDLEDVSFVTNSNIFCVNSKNKKLDDCDTNRNQNDIFSDDDNLSLNSNSSLFTNSTILSYHNENDLFPLSYFNRNPQWESSIFSKKTPIISSNNLKLGSQLSFLSHTNMNTNKNSNFILKTKQDAENTFIRIKNKHINKQKSCNLKTKRKCIDEVFPQIDLKAQSSSITNSSLTPIAFTSNMEMNWMLASSTKLNDFNTKRYERNSSYSSNEYETINDYDNNNNLNSNNNVTDFPLEKLNILY